MAENGARLQWSGVGRSIPDRLTTPSTLRLTVREVLEDVRYAARARQFGGWSAMHDGGETAAQLVERFATARAARPSVRHPARSG
jgi:UDP:flavonoid glycosyltransferase YjiC (YdhE family)